MAKYNDRKVMYYNSLTKGGLMLVKHDGVSERPVTFKDVNITGGLVEDMVFLHNGSASDVCGGFAVVAAGATVCFVNADLTSLTVSGIVRAGGSTIVNGVFIDKLFGALSMRKSSYVSNALVNNGGNLEVWEGATASNTRLATFGHMFVSSGGVACETHVGDGVFTAHRGAQVSVVDVGRDGVAHIEVNATVTDMTVESGGTAYVGFAMSPLQPYDSTEKTLTYLYISSGGYAEICEPGTQIQHVYVSAGGSLFVRSGCFADNVRMNKGGELKVEGGGSVTNLCGQGAKDAIKLADTAVITRKGK